VRGQKGFSLIELLIVVAIILILASIAVPSLMRARMRANEADAVAALRVIHTSAVAYSTTYPSMGYPATLATLGGANPCIAASTQACLIDDMLAQGYKDGYNFVWTGDSLVPSYGFFLTATPQVVGTSGQNMFCIDQSGVIRYDGTGSGCTATSQAFN
jgi:type IV pilus assembly protein PilA